jgi:imidazolonepropionase-like amidohydrolase
METLADLLMPGTGLVWLRVGTLLDGIGSAPVLDGHLVYSADTILHAGAEPPPAALLRPGQAAPDAVLPRHTVLPGLIEAHAHLFLEGGEEDPVKRAAYLQQSDAALLAHAEPRLGHLLPLGIIAVRDAGDRNGVGLALQARSRAAAPGRLPYLDSPGAAIHHQGRYGSFMGRPVEEFSSPAACVDGRLAEGAHRIKLIATGIINFEKGAVTTRPQMPVEELTAFTAAAKARGRQTFAHCSGHEGVSHCIAGGVDTIEHGFFVDAEQLARMRDAGIGWVPTFAPVQFQVDQAEKLGWSPTVRDNLQRILDGHAASLVRAAQLGVRIIAGSDAGSHGVPHGRGLLWEMSLMERAGLGALAVINAATGVSADRLGFGEDFGRLRRGARPRFILTEASPLVSVAHLTRARTVVCDGAVHVTGDGAWPAGL